MIYLKCLLLSLIFSSVTGFGLSQKTDSTKAVNNFKTIVSVTNNGLSLIPTFSLGEPAIIFDVTVGRRLSFDPLIRYSLEGKPWSFIFWWRYKIFKPGRFQFTIGVHPSVLFRTVTDSIAGVTNEIMIARRYLVGELFPNYILAKNISLGLYYNYSRGLGTNVARNTHFLTARAGFLNIKLISQLFLNVIPQVYYLRMDDLDGFYITSAFTISIKNFPISVSSVINKTIQSDIISDDFVWNVALNYTFQKQYVEY